ncbi:TPA: hypothetical protein ACGIY5_001480 [Corynebacterium striatum]
MPVDGPLATIIVAIIGVAGTVIGSVLTEKSQKKKSELETRGPEWESFTKSIREWTNEQLEARDKSTNEMRVEIADLRDKLEVWKSRYFIAANHIRQWRLRHPESVADMPIPDELENDF